MQMFLRSTRTVLTADLSTFDKSLRNWRKHLPNDFVIFFPVRSGISPSIDYFLVGLHWKKCSSIVKIRAHWFEEASALRRSADATLVKV